MDFSRPTKSGTIMPGNTTILRKGRTGSTTGMVFLVSYRQSWSAPFEVLPDGLTPDSLQIANRYVGIIHWIFNECDNLTHLMPK